MISSKPPERLSIHFEIDATSPRALLCWSSSDKRQDYVRYANEFRNRINLGWSARVAESGWRRELLMSLINDLFAALFIGSFIALASLTYYYGIEWDE
jgi:hypothetical protein